MENALDLASIAANPVAVAIIAGVIGLFIGWLLTYLLIGRGPSKSELAGKLAAVEDEYETHKQNVDAHFKTTSELVNDLTESYVKVYKHLSDGAESLSGVVDMRNRLTLDDADQPPSDTTQIDAEGNRVIEGAVAGVAIAGQDATPQDAPLDIADGADADAAPSEGSHDDPAFTVSDAAVAETLSELEANATPRPDAAASDSAAPTSPTDKPA